MKKFIAMFVFIFFATTVSTSIITAGTGGKKETQSAAHKHNDNKDGCFEMKNMSEAKKGDCCKMDSKKETEKQSKEESKKESEKK